ncbi:MAG: ribose ABC transporter permease [Lachnospiraceae bacterium]|nr:ribose ABC transporter permease [Lachnospiraceae bacterium]
MEQVKEKNRKKFQVSELSQYGIYFAFIVLCIIFAISNPVFLSLGNIINILRQISFNAILAMGMTMVIITGGIDLSVGSVLAIAAVVSASFIKTAEPVLPVGGAVLAGLAIGALCGFFNGLFVTAGNLPPFIATMVMMTIARGGAQLYTKGRPVSGLLPGFTFLGSGFILGIPVPVYLLAVVVLITYFILNKTRTGRWIYAVGGNESAARASGIKVHRVKMTAYIYCGMLAAFVGLIMTARLNSASPVVGDGYELDAIAAAVIGGTSMEGGKGKVFNVLLGALIIGTISNGLDILNVSSYWQQIVKGLIILVAVLIDRKASK